MWTVYERHTRGCAFPVSERCLSAARPEGERPFGSDLFRSAVALLFPVTSIHTTGGADIRLASSDGILPQARQLQIAAKGIERPISGHHRRRAHALGASSPDDEM